MAMARVLLLVALFVGLVAADLDRYDGHKVLRLSLEPGLLHGMKTILPTGTVDWWHDPSPSREPGANGLHWADIRVSPENYENVVLSLNAVNIPFRVMIEDLQPLVDAGRVEQTADDWFTAYHNYTATVDWLKALVQQYSNIADLVTIGTSYGGKTIYGIHITGQRSANASKPGIFNDGGIHAREWISPATVSYLAFNLLSSYGKDDRITKLVDAIEWTFVPIFNVDGYEYTWAKDRMWRKTRMPNAGTTCVGTDPCRNAATGWGQPGSSSSPCDETYRGKAAFDQPEVLAVASYVKKLGNIKYYNNFHSYSQLWMGPWGYTYSLPPAADLAKQNEVGTLAANSIKKVHGLTYDHGPVAPTIYQASGIMCDEVYASSGVILSYTCELRDTGAYGFVLPPAQIKPQGEEVLAATLDIAQWILDHITEL